MQSPEQDQPIIDALVSVVESMAQTPPCLLKLPYLKHIDLSGVSSLFPLLNAAPNLDYLAVCFECLETLLADEPTCHLLRRRIVRLNITDWVDVGSTILPRLADVFTSLRHLVISLKDVSVVIDDFVVTILSLWNKGRSRLSLDVKGCLSNKPKEALRQWIIDNTHLTANDSFAVECNETWFDLWF